MPATPPPAPFLPLPTTPADDVPGPDTGAAVPHWHGHRDRLRQRFLGQGADALADYELVELLLFQAIPRRDVKPLAKALLARFGSLWGLVSAPADVLATDFRLSDSAVAAIRVVGAAALRMARDEVINRPVLSSWEKLLDYCTGAMAHEATEQFRLLFLDRRNHLIRDEVQQRGTIDHTPVYPREVVKRALELGASALVLVHNHPSGDPTPSKADREMTKAIVQAATALGLVVHDHLIVGKGHRPYSFKANGLM